MINPIYLLPLSASFLITIILMPFWVKKAHQIGLDWKDMNKIGVGRVAGSGGIIVVLGFLVGVMLYVGYRTFFIRTESFLSEINALMLVLVMLSCVGLVDDLLGWQRGGLSKWSRLMLVFISAIPLMAINAGKSSISIPVFGSFDVGIIYPLFLVPLAIIGTGTTFNFLAGFNGLEALQGILILSGLSIASFLTGSSWLGVVSLCMVAALMGFIIYNWCPARVFPGDSMTYAIGGLIGTMAILGNFEKIAIFFFIPVIIEVLLKSRGGLVKQSFGIPQQDGSLKMPYKKIYSLNHLAIYLLEKMKVKVTERRVVILIAGFQTLILIGGFIIFRDGIFG